MGEQCAYNCTEDMKIVMRVSREREIVMRVSREREIVMRVSREMKIVIVVRASDSHLQRCFLVTEIADLIIHVWCCRCLVEPVVELRHLVSQLLKLVLELLLGVTVLVDRGPRLPQEQVCEHGCACE
jgi:hypothetical protein